MKVIVTNQSLDRLEESLLFYIEEMGIPLEKVIALKDHLLSRARGLSQNPYKGQHEPYLKILKQGHRRLIEGNFKIIYRIDEDVIYITDFFDSRKDPVEMRG